MHFSYYRRPLFLLLLLYAGGIFAFRDRLLRPPAQLPFALPRAGAVVEGRVAEYPAAVSGGLRLRLRTFAVCGRPLETGLMVYVRGDAGGASYGDTVSLLADLEEPPGASAPGGLDWREYLSRRGVTAQARAREVEVTRPAGAALLLARRFRHSALASFHAGLPPDAAAVFAGVVLGEKRSVPPELKAAFQDSGAMHLLVASGSNVGFLVAVVYFLCSRLGLRRRYSGLAALGLAGFYVLAAGLDAPLVRAYLMFSAGLAAWLLRRESGAFHALTAAALLILVPAPRYLFDAGFQMSFLAAYGLAVGLALWGRYLPEGLPGKALGLLLVSACAQLCLYPLLALYFHKISLVSLLSNMALVPASGAAMALGFLLALSGGPLFQGVAWLSGFFMDLFLLAVRFFAGLPFASVSVPEPSGWAVAGFYLLALALLHAPLAGFGRRFYLPAALGAAGMVYGLLPGSTAAAAAGYRVSLFGDADTASALVAAPTGLYLVNPGVSAAKLADAVLAQGTGALEGVLLTSLEEKNFSGLAGLAGAVRIRRIFLPPGSAPGKLKDALRAVGAERVPLWPGEAAHGVKAAWGAYGAGYTGRGDKVDWELGGVRIAREGALAESLCSPRASARAVRGKTTVLEIVPAAGPCGN